MKSEVAGCYNSEASDAKCGNICFNCVHRCFSISTYVSLAPTRAIMRYALGLFVGDIVGLARRCGCVIFHIICKIDQNTRSQFTECMSAYESARVSTIVSSLSTSTTRNNPCSRARMPARTRRPISLVTASRCVLTRLANSA